MRSAAQHRRRAEAPPEPPPRDLAADAAALLDRAAALLPLLEAGRADVRTVDETVFLGRAIGDLTAALEDAAAGQSVVEAVDAAAYARGWDAREAAGQQPSRPRHAGRGRHLRGLPSIPAAAAGVIVAAGLGSAAVAGLHDEASVRYAAASPAGHAALHPMAPDRAVVIPSTRWSPSPRPSMAAATASPAPAATPSPSVTSSPPAPSVSPPPPPVAVAAGPVLAAPGLLDLGGSHFGTLPLSVTGPGEVAWTATATDGITLQQSAGVVVSGQPVEIRVDDPAGDGGWIYFSAGSQALAVHVVLFGAPVVALP